MTDDIAFRRGTKADTAAMLELVRGSLGEGSTPRHSEYWSWKHHQSPFGASPSLLAVSAGQVVGLRVFLPWNWWIHGKTIRSVRAVDTATHPDWRGKGVFSRLTLKLLEQVRGEGINFVFNTPNKRSRPGYLKMGWVSLGRTSVWVRLLRPARIVRSLLSSAGPQPPMSMSDGCAPASELLRQTAAAELLRAVAHTSQLATVRTPEYCHWRYVAIPGLEYRATWDFDGDEGAAIIFRAKDQGRLRELRLCELLVGHGAKSRRIGRDLLNTLCRSATADIATGMATFGTATQRALSASGFLPGLHMGPVMTVRPLNDCGACDPLQRASWQLSIGDLEIF